MIRSGLDWLRHRWRAKHWLDTRGIDTRASGRRGEDLAHRFLERQGYLVVARNYRMASGAGEADLIAWENDTLAVVEVKSRESDEFGPPERAVDEEKRRHMLRVARDYATKSGTPWEKVRFDVVTVLLTNPPSIQLFRGALSSSNRSASSRNASAFRAGN